MNIEEILEDLYKLDPALRSEEAGLKDIIEKLIKQKPEAEAEQDFKERLKRELLEQVELKQDEQKKKRAGFFIVHRKTIVSAAGLAAALILILTFAVRPGLITGVMTPDKMTSSEAADFSGAAAVETEASAEPSAEAPVNEASAPQELERSDQEGLKSSKAALPNELKTEVPAEVSVMAGLSRAESSAPLMQKKSLDTLGYGAESDESGVYEEELMDVAIAEMQVDASNEEYSEIVDNGFIKTAAEPLSTFSIDVDTASYSNVRRFINSGMLPNPDAVRIEELINYFTYDYKQPDGNLPFSISTEFSECPWNSRGRLLHIGLQGYEVPVAELPPTNLVFLLDSSGSMQDDNKLPLLKESMSMMIDTLRPEDRVSIVAYAGSAGLVLPPTEGSNKRSILAAIDRLEAGGSTAGGAGIDLAYRTAAENIFKNGNNRVILATDGDFNVGQSSEQELKAMIEERRDQGIALTVLGLGMGNYKDARMEALADNGNGNYAYIDTLNEANKVLITELSSTLLTIAKDVKIQIDFNEDLVDSYRLIGYENRLMASEDFSNDKKDAGEIGAGHSVTALYEIIPADSSVQTGRLAEIKFRYKEPGEDQSKLIKTDIAAELTDIEDVSDNFMFSSAVAQWGMLLRAPENSSDTAVKRLIARASLSLGSDEYGYRKEFIELLKKTGDLLRQ